MATGTEIQEFEFLFAFSRRVFVNGDSINNTMLMAETFLFAFSRRVFVNSNLGFAKFGRAKLRFYSLSREGSSSTSMEWRLLERCSRFLFAFSRRVFVNMQDFIAALVQDMRFYSLSREGSSSTHRRLLSPAHGRAVSIRFLAKGLRQQKTKT